MNHFFAYVFRMRHILRWSLMRNAETENLSEHTAEVAMLAHALALIRRDILGIPCDVDRVTTLALYHDASEVITGDLPTPVKHNNPQIKQEYGRLEGVANRRLLSMLPDDLRADYKPLICHDEAAPEWRLVKAADKISAYIKCIEEKKAGNTEFENAAYTIRSSIDRIDLPEVRDFMRECVPGFGMTLDEISQGDELAGAE